MEKRCCKCHIVKPVDEFHKWTFGKYGRYTQCKECRKIYRKPYDQKYYQENKDGKERDRHLRNSYGMTLQEYNQLLEEQNGVCAICGAKYAVNGRTKEGHLYVDHNHTTGKVRGLLCARCNFAVGFVEVNPELLYNINKYLAKGARL